MGAAALIGGGMMVAGNTASAVGANQANRAQERVNANEMSFQDDLDRQAAQRLARLLESENTDNRMAETQAATTGEADALDAVARAVTEARGKTTAAGSETAQGEITRSMEGVAGRAGRSAKLLARIRAQKIAEEESRTRGKQYAVDRNRIAGKSASRSRLYPLLMNAAAMRGAETRQAGSATSALGALLLQYGLSGSGETGGPNSSLEGAPASTTGITEAPTGGWAAQNPVLA